MVKKTMEESTGVDKAGGLDFAKLLLIKAQE